MQELARFREIGSGLFFPSPRNPIKPFEFRRHWNRALLEAGIEDFRFHDKRHSAASYLAFGGTDLKDIAAVLGHKSLQTTQRYTHLNTKHKQELTDRILGGVK